MHLNDVHFLVLPGWQDSDSSHWQTRFERELGATRVQQKDWMRPKRADWLDRIQAAVSQLTKPGVFITHSLGGIAAAHWAGHYSGNIAGAVLVAPPDIDRTDMPTEIADFRPEPRKKLFFPSLLVSSSSDPYIELDKAKTLAQAWGSQFVEAKASGHINPDAGFGEWPEGMRLLTQFVDEL